MENNSNSGFQLRAMLEALPYVSWFKDADGNFSMVNAQLLTSLQKGLFEVVGKRNQEIFDPDEARLNEVF